MRSILFDDKSDTPKSLRKVEECPMLDTTSRLCGYLVVASSALLMFIMLGGF